MTEIFYRLKNLTNSNYLVLKKKERHQLVKQSIEELLENKGNLSGHTDLTYKLSKKELQTISAILDIIKAYNILDLQDPNNLKNRKNLADKCLEKAAEMKVVLNKRLVGYNYEEMRVSEIQTLIYSPLTSYFTILLFLLECRGKLLEYLLD